MQHFWAADGNQKWTFRTRQDSGLSQILKLTVSSSKKRLNNINVVVWREVKYENSALLVAVRGSKTLHAEAPYWLEKHIHI